MDPRDTYPRPPPVGETWSTHGLSLWIFEKHYELAQTLADVVANQRTSLANQQANKADILEHIRVYHEHHSQRMDDFKDEIIPRLERLESRPSKPEAESSLAKSLFGSIGVFLWGVIPWKHLGLMLPGILLAIAGNLAPEGTKRFIVAAVEIFWRAPQP